MGWDSILSFLILKWPYLAFLILGILAGGGVFFTLNKVRKDGKEERKSDRKDYIDELVDHNSLLQETSQEAKQKLNEIAAQLKDKEALILQKDSILLGTQNLTRLLLDDNTQMKDKIEILSAKLQATEFALMALNWIFRRENFSRLWLIQILIRSKPKDNEQMVMGYFSQNVDEINAFLNQNDDIFNSINFETNNLTESLVEALAKLYLALPIAEDSEKIKLIDQRHRAFVEKEDEMRIEEKKDKD